ncbi:hypothetical protein EDB83DRAFT_2322273 [Lactarius deliciosus]|nr:hypothetical protein EDB83DRAFT_2322271 [Lactarius deliciosus]KAH9011093.1 hypothetical protein EDB83DRAFT_2322273 [Lactarius deliciosus]
MSSRQTSPSPTVVQWNANVHISAKCQILVGLAHRQHDFQVSYAASGSTINGLTPIYRYRFWKDLDVSPSRTRPIRPGRCQDTSETVLQELDTRSTPQATGEPSALTMVSINNEKDIALLLPRPGELVSTAESGATPASSARTSCLTASSRLPLFRERKATLTPTPPYTNANGPPQQDWQYLTLTGDRNPHVLGDLPLPADVYYLTWSADTIYWSTSSAFQHPYLTIRHLVPIELPVKLHNGNGVNGMGHLPK